MTDSSKGKVIQLNRAGKIVLLQWLKRGYIDTAEFPELCDLVTIEVIDRREQVETDADSPESY